MVKKIAAGRLQIPRSHENPILSRSGKAAEARAVTCDAQSRSVRANHLAEGDAGSASGRPAARAQSVRAFAETGKSLGPLCRMHRATSPSDIGHLPEKRTGSRREGQGRRHYAWTRALSITLLVVIGLLLLIRFVGSPIVTNLANRKLSSMPGFTGNVGEVHLALWRAAVEVSDVALFERGSDQSPPVLKVKSATVVVSYLNLLRGKFSGKITVDQAEVVEVAKPKPAGEKVDRKDTKEKVQETKESAVVWQDALAKAFPIEITRLELKDSKIRIVDPTRQPNVDVGIEHLHLVATGLRNRPEGDDPFPAKVKVEATTTGDGRLTVFAEADPLAKRPRFNARMELKDMDLPPFNSFLLAYANADVSRGKFDFYLETTAQNGAYQGYVKPFFKDLDFRTASDENKSAGQLLVKKVVAGVTNVLKNKEEEKVATKAPFSGNFSDNQVDIWTTIRNLLRNAFVQGLREGLEGQTPRIGQ